MPMSIDTRNAVVAEQAIAAGADWINDVSGGIHDPNMLSLCSKLAVPIVMMHMRGTPQTMTSATNTSYADLITDVGSELQSRFAAADSARIPRWNQIADPGVGFAKKPHDNLTLLSASGLDRFRGLVNQRPLYIGASRKKFIGQLIEQTLHQEPSLSDRDFGTAAVACAASAQRVELLRVHNVRAVKAALSVFEAIRDNHN